MPELGSWSIRPRAEEDCVRKRSKSRHGDDRPIALGAATTALLKEHRARGEARAREWGGELAPDAYVFSTDEAARRPLRVDTVKRRFGKLAKDLGHDYTLYGFRHFVATQLGAVATSATIRERMGHGSLEVTSGYVHRVSEADRRAARHMDALLDGKPTKPAADRRRRGRQGEGATGGG
jgi:integrase